MFGPVLVVVSVSAVLIVFVLVLMIMSVMLGRMICAESKPGYPCRVSLQDAEVGDTVILLPFAHLDAASPYRASGPIFVRADADTARLAVNEIPEMLSRRLLSLRAYDSGHMMIDAATLEGSELAETLGRWFDNAAVEYVHVHNARPGCFNCAVE